MFAYIVLGSKIIKKYQSPPKTNIGSCAPAGPPDHVLDGLPVPGDVGLEDGHLPGQLVLVEYLPVYFLLALRAQVHLVLDIPVQRGRVLVQLLQMGLQGLELDDGRLVLLLGLQVLLPECLVVLPGVLGPGLLLLELVLLGHELALELHLLADVGLLQHEDGVLGVGDAPDQEGHRAVERAYHLVIALVVGVGPVEGVEQGAQELPGLYLDLVVHQYHRVHQELQLAHGGLVLHFLG